MWRRQHFNSWLWLLLVPWQQMLNISETQVVRANVPVAVALCQATPKPSGWKQNNMTYGSAVWTGPSKKSFSYSSCHQLEWLKSWRPEYLKSCSLTCWYLGLNSCGLEQLGLLELVSQSPCGHYWVQGAELLTSRFSVPKTRESEQTRTSWKL